MSTKEEGFFQRAAATGFAAELLFASECLKRHYHTYRSMNPSSRWDFIINGLNVDVKYSNRVAEKADRALLHGCKDERVDIIAILREGVGWHLIPGAIVPQNKHTTSLAWSIYGCWQDRWDLLEGTLPEVLADHLNPRVSV